jgi:hypothetical protein
MLASPAVVMGDPRRRPDGFGFLGLNGEADRRAVSAGVRRWHGAGSRLLIPLPRGVPQAFKTSSSLWKPDKLLTPAELQASKNRLIDKYVVIQPRKYLFEPDVRVSAVTGQLLQHLPGTPSEASVPRSGIRLRRGQPPLTVIGP